MSNKYVEVYNLKEFLDIHEIPYLNSKKYIISKWDATYDLVDRNKRIDICDKLYVINDHKRFVFQ